MNDNKCSCECQITIKDYVCENGDWNNGMCTCKNGKYSGSIVSDSVIRCDENIKVTKTVPTRTVAAKLTSTKSAATNFNEKKVTCKIKRFYILTTFLLITIPLLIIVSIYGYFVKYRSKQEHSLPHNIGNNKWKEIDIKKRVIDLKKKI